MDRVKRDEISCGKRGGRNREDEMKFVMMLAIFGVMTAFLALIGLSDEPHSAYQTSDRVASFQ
jgi:hypothetical protein